MAYRKGEYIEVPVPEQMNIASMLIDENVTGGRADKKAIYFAGEPPKYLPADLTYRGVQRFVLRQQEREKMVG